jgi:hypothetical protein
MGWVLFPSSIEFADGTKWRPEQQNECFTIYWRDKDHPDLPALPPLQIEMKED